MTNSIMQTVAEVSTGIRITGLSASATTEAVSLGLVLDGTPNVEHGESVVVHPTEGAPTP
jgi:hypothetical protein